MLPLSYGFSIFCFACLPTFTSASVKYVIPEIYPLCFSYLQKGYFFPLNKETMLM